MYKFVSIKGPFDIRKDFWDANFQISLIEPFRSLYLRDTSESHHISSKEMWCIWLYKDPNYENKIYRLKENEKISAIQAYYPEFDFNDPLIATCILEYPDHCLSPAAKAFMQEDASMIQRSQFIAQAEYTFDEVERNRDGAIVFTKMGVPIVRKGTASTIDGMRKLTLDIMERYQQVRKVFEEEQHMLRIYGGGNESLAESAGFEEIEDDDDENFEEFKDSEIKDLEVEIEKTIEEDPIGKMFKDEIPQKENLRNTYIKPKP